jgi:hypothetical protein
MSRGRAVDGTCKGYTSVDLSGRESAELNPSWEQCRVLIDDSNYDVVESAYLDMVAAVCVDIGRDSSVPHGKSPYRVQCTQRRPRLVADPGP